MTKRRFITQLPFINQTPDLKKFFSQTIDQVFQPGETQSINAFIGKKPSYYNATRDFYKTEINAERAFYQLEPAMTTTSAPNGVFEDLLFYPDVVNQLRFQGANTSNHSRLFNTDYYTWCPPVNIRKLDAYREYYWLPDGPPVMVFDIPVAGGYSIFKGDGFNKSFKIPYRVAGLSDGIIVEINGVRVPSTSYDIIDNHVVLHSVTATTANVPAPGINDVVQIVGNASYRTNGVLNAFHVPKTIPDSVETIVVMIDDEVIVNGLVWDGNIDDGLLADGNVPVGLIDGNIDVTYSITNGILSFSSVVPANRQVRIWLNGDFKNNIVGKPSYTYPVSATVYALETITEQYSDPNDPSKILSRTLVKKYDDKELPLPPQLTPDMRVQINDNNGINLYQVNMVNGSITLKLVSELAVVREAVPQFITIERNATNENEWSTRNHWYNREVLIYGNASYQPYQATRPIIEYFNNVQLFNYGAHLLKPVDLVLDDVNVAIFKGSTPGTVALEGLLDSDVTVPPVVRDVEKERLAGVAHLPLIHGVYIQPGSRILINNSADPAIKLSIAEAKIYNVSTPYDPDEFAPVSNFDMDNLWDNVDMITFDIQATHALDQVKVNNTTKQYWSTGYIWKEISYYVGQEPLFDLFDRAGVSLNDATKYPGTNFLGSKIFTYDRNVKSPIDLVLKLRVSRNKYGLIEFRDHLTSDVWTYRNNTFQGYTYFGQSSITSEIASLAQHNNWYAAGSTFQTKNADGLYSIPTNLQANPTNKEVEIIAPNDWKAQFNQLLAGSNWNLSSDQFNLAAGSHIVQSRGTMLKTMLLSSDQNIDFIKSAIYNEHEYTRYRNKLVNLLKQYEIQTGLDNITLAVTDIMTQLKSAKTADFPFYNNGIIGDYYIPASAAYLGMSALWKPELILEIGRTGSIILIRGHDGSITPGASRFNTKTIAMTIDNAGNYTLVDSSIVTPEDQPTINAKDLALLSFEKMYYDSTMIELQSQRRPAFDIKEFTPSKFRTTEYTREEYLTIARPIFERWVTKTSLKYRVNTIYDGANKFTWNYRGLTDIDGQAVPGFWRGIYQHYFDTDRPHTHPWEMLGFTSKPQWWDSAYSWTDATQRQSLIMALTMGLVSSPGGTPVYDLAFARGPIIDPETNEVIRHGIESFIPVDQTGKLLNPFDAGIVVEDEFGSYDGDWAFGDMAPVEYQWASGISHSFIAAQMSYLMKPVKFLESNWETADEIEVYGYDWVSKKTGRRTQLTDYQIHNEIVNNNTVRVLGLQTWLSDYLRSTGKDVTAYLGDRVRGLGVNLAHKLGGFVDAASLSTFTENTGLIPQEDVKTVTYNSPSIREEFYGGVIVQWTGRGWKVVGYDVVDPAFKILPVDQNGSKSRITADDSVETTVNDWHQNTYYQVTVPTLYQGNTYRCTKTHTSARGFESEFWVIDNSIVRDSVTALLFYNQHHTAVERVPYNTEFYSKQEVADFLSGYQAYLVSRGWDFETYDSTQNVVLDWKYACKEFLSWTQVRWTPNTFIALSPAAAELKFFSSHGNIQSVEQLVNGVYSLLGKEGQAIDKRNVTASRTDTGITVSVVNDAIYGLRISINEIEQAVVFHNQTIFNDVIYQPLFDVRQNRIRLITLLTSGWTGKLDAPGFIVTNNRVLPSFEKQVDDIRNMYDIEKTISLPLRENAQHQIGYQNRPYLEQLMYNEVNQFEFYQGMIQQKGAPGVFSKLMRNDELTQTRNLSFLEEWAFRTGEYGGTEINSFFEIELPRSAIQQDPQLVVFRQSDSYWDLGDFDSEPNANIIVFDEASYQENKNKEYLKCFEVGTPTNVDPTKLSSMDPDDAVVEMVSAKDVYDSRIIMPYKGTPFIFDNSYMPKKGGMPTAGYARIDEAEWMGLNVESVNAQLLASPSDLKMYQRVWLYADGTWQNEVTDSNIDTFASSGDDNWIYHPEITSWAMYRATSSMIHQQPQLARITSSRVVTVDDTNVIAALYPDENGVKIEFAYEHNLAPRDRIYIDKLVNAVSGLGGINMVTQVIDNTTIIIDGDIISKHEYIDETRPAVLLLFKVRQSISDINLISANTLSIDDVVNAGVMLPSEGLMTNELLYLDITQSVANTLTSDVQRWRVFIWDENYQVFQKYRTQPHRVRSDLIRDIKIFDTTATRTKRTLNAYPLLNQDILVYDPVQGLIPGVATKEITYQLETDPAFYNVGPDVQDVGFDWGMTQVGQLWWNMSTTRFLEYATDDTTDDTARITELHSLIEMQKVIVATRVATVEAEFDNAYHIARAPLEAKVAAFQAFYGYDSSDDIDALNYLKLMGDPDFLAFDTFEHSPYLVFDRSVDWDAIEYLRLISDEAYVKLINMQNELPSRQSEIDQEIKYRKDNWGSIAPNSTIDIYEWTRSTISPTEWSAAVTAGTNPTMYEGIVLNADDPDWVEKIEWDEQLAEDITVYYFWVKDKKVTPRQKDFRSMSSASVASIITDPGAAGLAWAAPVADYAFIITGVMESLNTTSTIQFKVATVDSEVQRHVEWEIMREGDERSVPTFALWDKITQSLTGRNHKGEVLPSDKRYVTDRIGFDVEHGQSLFSNVANARKHLTQYLNTLFANILIVDERRDLSVIEAGDMNEQVLQWYQKQDSFYTQPLPDTRLYDRVFDTQEDFVTYINASPANLSTVGLVYRTGRTDSFWAIMSAQNTVPQYNTDGSIIPDAGTLDTLWDITVDSMAELNALLPSIAPNKKVKVNGSEDTGNFATIWKLNSMRTAFTLVTTEQFTSNDLYRYIDWFAPGYSLLNPPNITCKTIMERDTQFGTNPTSVFIKVLDDGRGRWVWMRAIDGVWRTVAKQNGTIQITDSLWKNTGNILPAFTELPSNFASLVKSRDLGYELNVFLNGLRDYIFTSNELNALFFSMISYIHTEQSAIDWCFKTSFMYVTGYTERLMQDPVAYVDRTSNLLQYINEVKPYHVKIRGFISKYGVSDTANIKATDFDLPMYYDTRLGKFRPLNPAVPTDVSIMKSGVWNDWYQQYLRNDNQFVRKLNVSLGGYDFNNPDRQIISETANISVAESIRLRVFRRGNIGAPTTSSQTQTSTSGANVTLPIVMPQASSIAVFADGLRVDPALVTFDPYKSRVTTPASASMPSPYNTAFNYEVAGFGYGSTGTIRDIKYFNKTSTENSYYLGDQNTSLVVSQLMVTVGGVKVPATINNGVVTVSDTLPDGLVQIAILDTTDSHISEVITTRFDAAAIANKSLAELYPELVNPARWPMMNNFIIEIDGFRVAPEMFYQVNINTSNRRLRMDRDAPLSDLDIRFNGTPIQVGTNLVRRVTINATEREANLGQGLNIADIKVTDMAGNPMIVGRMSPSNSIDPEHPGVITAGSFRPANAVLILDKGHLIHIGAMTTDMDVLVSIDNYIPHDMTDYSWTPANARFVKVNDAIVSTQYHDTGVLTVSDKLKGEIDIMRPISDKFNASIVTITDFQDATMMGSRTWTFRTDIKDFFPINAHPIVDSAVWVNLNGRRLVNGVHYRIVEARRNKWNGFIWDNETWDSLDYAAQGTTVRADPPFDIVWDENEYDMASMAVWGIELLIDTTPNDLLVATVFDAQQASYARTFELFIKEQVDQLFDSTNFDFEAWDHDDNYTVPREITLADRYELVTDITRDTPVYKIRQVVGPFTRDRIDLLEIENKLWVDKEYLVMSNIVPGVEAEVTTTRGDCITSKLPHVAFSEVVAPRIIGPERRYMPL